MLNQFKKIHFVGIGGIGMSGLAKILLALGYEVSGSDKRENFCIHKLRKQGAKIFIGHRESNIEDDTDAVVYSSAIPFGNPELLKAKEKKIPLLHRADILSFIMQSRIGIAVAGAHGKTTIAAMLAHLLSKADFNPTVTIGGWLNQYETNAWLGRGSFMVAEADESDSSFMKLSPFYSIVNNIDYEHLDHYKDIAEIVYAYQCFMKKTRDMGCVFFCYDDTNLREIIPKLHRRCVSYGFNPLSDVHPVNILLKPGRIEFECIYFGKKMGEFSLQIPGRHNVLNAQAAIAVARELNIAWEKIKDALSTYPGTGRRFQIRKFSPVMIVDDYAHHPNEIRATLEAASTFKKKRIIAVFQPHRYSRIYYLKEKFADAFTLADKLLVTDIYSADENPIPGIDGCMLWKEILRKTGRVKDIFFLKREKIIPSLLEMIRKDDLILMLGAGDITTITDELVKRI